MSFMYACNKAPFIEAWTEQHFNLPPPSNKPALCPAPHLTLKLLELLMSLVGLTRYAKMVRPALPEMAYLVVGYMQAGARGGGTLASQR